MVLHRHAMTCWVMIVEVSTKTAKIKPGCPHNFFWGYGRTLLGLFCDHLGFTTQIKSATLKGNHFRPFITYIILYPDTSSKEAWFDDYLVMMGYVDLLGMDPEGWVYLGFTWGL